MNCGWGGKQINCNKKLITFILYVWTADVKLPFRKVQKKTTIVYTPQILLKNKFNWLSEKEKEQSLIKFSKKNYINYYKISIEILQWRMHQDRQARYQCSYKFSINTVSFIQTLIYNAFYILNKQILPHSIRNVCKWL